VVVDPVADVFEVEVEEARCPHLADHRRRLLSHDPGVAHVEVETERRARHRREQRRRLGRPFDQQPRLVLQGEPHPEALRHRGHLADRVD